MEQTIHHEPCCGLDTLLETLGGNQGIALKLARLFLGNYPKTQAALAQAAQAADLPEVKRLAHEIRGNCAVFAAEQCLGLARKLENDLTDEYLAEWEEDCRQLQQAMAAVAQELQDFADHPDSIAPHNRAQDFS